MKLMWFVLSVTFLSHLRAWRAMRWKSVQRDFIGGHQLSTRELKVAQSVKTDGEISSSFWGWGKKNLTLGMTIPRKKSKIGNIYILGSWVSVCRWSRQVTPSCSKVFLLRCFTKTQKYGSCCWNLMVSLISNTLGSFCVAGCVAHTMASV